MFLQLCDEPMVCSSSQHVTLDIDLELSRQSCYGVKITELREMFDIESIRDAVKYRRSLDAPKDPATFNKAVSIVEDPKYAYIGKLQSTWQNCAELVNDKVIHSMAIMLISVEVQDEQKMMRATFSKAKWASRAMNQLYSPPKIHSFQK